MIARIAARIALFVCLIPALSLAAELPLNEYFAGLMTVDAKLSKRPLKLLFDTGGGGIILSPEAVAGHCQPFGRLVGHRFNGEALAMPRCTPLTLSLGEFQKHGEVALFDVMPMLGNAPKIDGILGLSAFEHQPVLIDYEQKRIKTMDRRALARVVRRERMTEIPIRLERQAGGASLDVFVGVEAKPGPLWLELDSGNVGPVLLAPHALTQLQQTLSETPGPISLTLQGLPPITVTAEKRESIYDGLTSAELARRYVWAFDFERGRAWARPIPVETNKAP